jgi:hypothetical protein
MFVYQTFCRAWRMLTSKQYARKHDGQCKRCAEPEARQSQPPARNERILEHGYEAYAREEDY